MLDDDIERRLLAMALWYHTREGGGYMAMTNAYEGLLLEEHSGYRETSAAFMEGECKDTYDAVEKLPDNYRLAIWAQYLNLGPKMERLGDLTQKQVANRFLGCSLATYQRWLNEGKRRLKDELWWMREAANAPYLSVANAK